MMGNVVIPNKKPIIYLERPTELGMLLVVGGPGGSGSSTIAKMLAQYYQIQYIYSGGIMRSVATKYGFTTYEDFITSTLFQEKEGSIDKEVDYLALKNSMTKDILIEGKVFAAIATIRKIKCTTKIWIDANLDARAHRVLYRSGKILKNRKLSAKSPLLLETKQKLIDRYENDKARYKKLYDVEYDHPEYYNDILIDASKIGIGEVFNLVVKFINNGNR